MNGIVQNSLRDLDTIEPPNPNAYQQNTLVMTMQTSNLGHMDATKDDCVRIASDLFDRTRSEFDALKKTLGLSRVQGDGNTISMNGMEAKLVEQSAFFSVRDTAIIPVIINAMSGLIDRGSFPAIQRNSTTDAATKELGPHPSIAAVSRKWGLNLEQHIGFIALSSALLHRLLMRVASELNLQNYTAIWSQLQRAKMMVRLIIARYRQQRAGILDVDPQLRPADDQLICFICGSGGTGKSRIICALYEFAKCWNVLNCIAVTATSGIASVLLQGQTYHKVSRHLCSLHYCGANLYLIRLRCCCA